ncbi:uncharacterized protein LOC119370750 [Jatropha curcas]|uniref:uncharacterized protein LOC119370750 n=1 Tax=Jatropha curcas TaxID=180498 RepID=UPI001893E460|nr:uncharacterized protein LOC119370750 [Jatropha curcas]
MVQNGSRSGRDCLQSALTLRKVKFTVSQGQNLSIPPLPIQRKAIKGSVIADHLAASPRDAEIEYVRFPDEVILLIQADQWKMYFNGAANYQGCSAGVVIVTPDGKRLPFSIKLAFQIINNEAEYEACIVGLEAALSIQIKRLTIYGDSILIVSQALKKWKIKEQRLLPYLRHLDHLAQ